MKVLRSLLQAHDAAMQTAHAISNAMHAVVEDSLEPDSTPAPTLPPEPSSGPTLVVDEPKRPSMHVTRAMPKVTSAVFEEYIQNAWSSADTDAKKTRVRDMVNGGAARGILDAAAIDRLTKLVS